ncbi:MAG: hypothetical protein Q9M91_05010 [Candidatus Dojkabacteria bacterium]|nr:hypothetical protein [Candidatus Dojkabacteria bacterium]MDQ7021167.1 hypothetical protein [Candidatus Dojkabacteria bacterium]
MIDELIKTGETDEPDDLDERGNIAELESINQTRIQLGHFKNAARRYMYKTIEVIEKGDSFNSFLATLFSPISIQGFYNLQATIDLALNDLNIEEIVPGVISINFTVPMKELAAISVIPTVAASAIKKVVRGALGDRLISITNKSDWRTNNSTFEVKINLEQES